MFYEVYVTDTSGMISISGIICNDGVTGEAQFGIWKNCTCVGTYTAACFKSCAVGSGAISLSGLIPGQSYILVIDGQAGDICRWNLGLEGASLNPPPLETTDLNEEATLQIFPNPVSDQLVIEGKNIADYNRLELIDPLGRVVCEQIIQSSSVLVDVSHLTSGLYSLYFSGENQVYISRVQVLK